MCKPFPVILPLIGGFVPAYFKRKIWGKYEVQTMPTDSLRQAPISHLLPYFWDSEVCIGLYVTSLKVNKATEILSYKWELCGLDGNAIQTGQDTIKVEPNKMWFLFGIAQREKRHAIPLGYLSPNKNYRVFVTFQKSDENPVRELMAAFTVQDRDEIKMQAFILIFGIVITLILTKLFA